MNTIFLSLANTCFLLFFVMRIYCNKKWGKADSPKTIIDFIKKEFLVILFTIVVFLQNVGIGITFSVFIPVKIILVLGSIMAVFTCYQVRAFRAKNWGRFGTSSKGILVTNGPNYFSRHPYYLGVVLWGYSVSLLYGNILMLIICSVWVFGALYAARKEEYFLEEEFGFEWTEYKKRTPFLLGVPKR